MSGADLAFRFLEDLPVTSEEACPYLPVQRARYRAFFAESVPPMVYHELMNRRFRRSGDYFYEPVCRTCEACIPIRVPVAQFQPTRGQRRVTRRNLDLAVTIAQPSYSEEKFHLYRRYCREWHGKADADEEDFSRFLIDSPVDSLEFQYRDPAGRLLAAGLCDVSPAGLSSVYFYFDPTETRRSLGTFGVLKEIEFAQESKIPHYYLGYWVDGSATMSYKARFGPHELLINGRWQSSTGSGD